MSNPWSVVAAWLALMSLGLAHKDNRVFLDQQHAKSTRYVVLEANGSSAWMYLTARGKPKPEKDAFVYSAGPLVTNEEAKAAGERGEPPPLAAEYASSVAIIKD